MKIRKADKSDAEAISDLIIPLTEKYILPTWGEEAHDLLLGSMAQGQIEQYLSDGYVYHVAESASVGIVGVVGIRDNSHLYHLFVKDGFNGQGLSRQLWEKGKSDCLLKGNKGEFTVNSALNAEDVYLKFGFERIDGIRERNGMVDIPMKLHCTG